MLLKVKSIRGFFCKVVDRFDVDVFAFELELLLEAEFQVRELSTDAVEVSADFSLRKMKRDADLTCNYKIDETMPVH